MHLFLIFSHFFVMNSPLPLQQYIRNRVRLIRRQQIQVNIRFGKYQGWDHRWP